MATAKTSASPTDTVINPLQLRLYHAKLKLKQTTMKGTIIPSIFKSDYRITLNNSTLDVFFKSIFSSEVNTLINGYEHSIKPDNMWFKNFTVYESGRKIGTVKYDWKGNSTITLGEKEYHLKVKGFWKKHLVLTNTEGSPVLTVQPEMIWKKLKYIYHIEPVSEELSDELSPVLFWVISYCMHINVNHYFSM